MEHRMSHATYQDAELILKLYEMRRDEKLRAARAWFGGFSAQSWAEVMEKYPPGSEHNAYFRMVTSYWEMASSFVVRGVVHEELFFENNGELLFVWERVKGIVEDYRRVRGNPMLMRNLVKVATKHIAWLNHNAPGAYEKFQAMMNPKK
jgi:hypothetical protein